MLEDALSKGFTEPIRDALWGHIYMTAPLAALTRTEAFTRLHRIFQLGPVYLLYPGATHTRAGHSIGVYHLCRRLLLRLTEEGAGEWLTEEGAASFLCAGLLHDLGHFPYTHSLKELPLLEHEKLSAAAILSEPLKTLIGRAGADPALTAAIIDKKDAASGEELCFYRRLLSGALDPDKLDYLNRDAHFCGVPYGAQDVDFILSRMRPHRERGADIDSGGIPSVESLLFSKYLMYRTVYWHRWVRSATAMIKKALLWGLARGLIAGEELYNLDDQGLFTLMSSRAPRPEAGHPFRLAAMVRGGELYRAAAEIPFDEALHAPLLPVLERSRWEEALAGALEAALGGGFTPGDVIIDIPEPVSLETGLFVSDQGCLFAESTSPFKLEAVDAFVKSLRVLRVFISPVREAALDAASRAKLPETASRALAW